MIVPHVSEDNKVNYFQDELDQFVLWSKNKYSSVQKAQVPINGVKKKIVSTQKVFARDYDYIEKNEQGPLGQSRLVEFL